MWAQESVAIKVDHVVWVIGDPYFGFPRYISSIFTKFGTVWKSCYVYNANYAVFECFLQFYPTLG